MARAYVGVGANVEPAENVRRALRLLAAHERLTAVSSVYRTPPLGRPEQDDYYNCVVEIETSRPPLELKRQVLRRIEREMGRTRGPDRYAARTIDLDLLAYDDLRLESEELTLPAPDIAERDFVAVPLAELAPTLLLPERGITVAEAASRLAGGNMVPLPHYTESLRGELEDG
ncbi:MAG: 2-amino-4-hydroxy-6-hydroxymethyldihydropteridine diphosphokinase [Anaerolineae bacterium]